MKGFKGFIGLDASLEQPHQPVGLTWTICQHGILIRLTAAAVLCLHTCLQTW